MQILKMNEKTRYLLKHLAGLLDIKLHEGTKIMVPFPYTGTDGFQFGKLVDNAFTLAVSRLIGSTLKAKDAAGDFKFTLINNGYEMLEKQHYMREINNMEKLEEILESIVETDNPKIVLGDMFDDYFNWKTYKNFIKTKIDMPMADAYDRHWMPKTFIYLKEFKVFCADKLEALKKKREDELSVIRDHFIKLQSDTITDDLFMLTDTALVLSQAIIAAENDGYIATFKRPDDFSAKVKSDVYSLLLNWMIMSDMNKIETYDEKIITDTNGKVINCSFLDGVLTLYTASANTELATSSKIELIWTWLINLYVDYVKDNGDSSSAINIYMARYGEYISFNILDAVERDDLKYIIERVYTYLGLNKIKDVDGLTVFLD